MKEEKPFLVERNGKKKIGQEFFSFLVKLKTSRILNLNKKRKKICFRDMMPDDDDEMLMKEIREHINDIASEFGQDGVSYILVKDELEDKYVLF